MTQSSIQKSQNQEYPVTTDQFEIGSLSIALGNEGPQYIHNRDLDEHFYIIGRSGTGKSNLLKELALADAARGAGLCFIDPIGSTAEALVGGLSRRDASCAPGHDDDVCHNIKSNNHVGRSDKDIIYFDAADVDYPIGINPLYNIAPEDRAKTVSDILHMFEGIWHDSGWGPRMESIFRATLHTLVENPNCMHPSLLTVFRLLLDEGFRKDTKSAIQNSQVLDWWDYRFDRSDLNERTRREWIEPVLNKIDTLSLDPVIRNIIGQPRCSLDFEEIIRRKQILIVNLNQNRVGLDNAAFIGMLILSRIRQAASKVGKQDQPFTLTVDEAHSFPTTELSRIIHQGRHSGLFARIAHQNLEQFDQKIGSALRNGCGSLAVFAVGSRDAESIIDDLEHQHRDRCREMINSLERGQCFLRLTRDGAPQPPGAYPISVKYRQAANDQAQSKRRLSGVAGFTRQRFATSRLAAEFQITFAHDQFNRKDHLKWKSLFREERKQRSRNQGKRKQARYVRKNKLKQTAFGGAATELQQIADHIFGSTKPGPDHQTI